MHDMRVALTILLTLVAAEATAQARSLQDVVYTTVPRPLVLDLHLPATRPPHPLIVWIHGGGWRSGDEDLPPNHPARQLVARGYAVASVEYRLSGEAVFPAQIQDCRAAIRWLRAHAGVIGLDAERFAVWGASAGGHLASLVGTAGDVTLFDDPLQGHAGESSRVQAAVDWYGPSDLTYPAGAPGEDGQVAQLLGCTGCPEQARLASPVTYVDVSDPPFLIQHGTRDPVVGPFQSEMLHSALLAAAVPSTYDLFEGAGHGGPAFSDPQNVARVQAFLDRALRR
jgi:acetyl esterase/lipase